MHLNTTTNRFTLGVKTPKHQVSKKVIATLKRDCAAVSNLRQMNKVEKNSNATDTHLIRLLTAYGAKMSKLGIKLFPGEVDKDVKYFERYLFFKNLETGKIASEDEITAATAAKLKNDQDWFSSVTEHFNRARERKANTIQNKTNSFLHRN